MSEVALRAENIQVAFGGLKAVDGLTLEAQVGQVNALIGPNGAGKTTTFNACSGVIRPNGGRVELFGEDVTRQGVSARARAGLGRTFQRMELFGSMTVRENVALGRECGYAGRNPLRQVIGGPRERAEVREAAEEAMELCAIADIAGRQTSALSTGQRRLVELARVVAGRFRVLLLDEPSSGLDRHETDWFGDLLLRLSDERGMAILMVEHDMDMALRVSKRVFVLDFGKPLFEGTPEAVRSSELVRRAYLGDELEGMEDVA